MPNHLKYTISKYLTLKLEQDGKTHIYVNGIKFNQCKFLLLQIPTQDIRNYDEIESIDEAAEKLNHSLEHPNRSSMEIPPETEFWGHCSNLQVWVEHQYDTRLLHRNLAFPLLKRLTDAGDPVAKRVFKEEIAMRATSGYAGITTYLIEAGYLDYLSKGELESLFEGNQDPVVLYQLAYIYIKKNKIAKAIDVLERVIVLDPNYKIAWKYLISLYNKDHQYENAIQAFEKMLSIEPMPNYETIRNNLVNFFFNIKEYKFIIAVHKIILSYEPDNAHMWNQLGNAYRYNQQYGKAVDAIRKAIEFDHINHKFWNHLGVVYMEKGDYKRAFSSYKKALGISEDSREIMMNLIALIKDTDYINLLPDILYEFPNKIKNKLVRMLFYKLRSENKNQQIEYNKYILESLKKDLQKLKLFYVIYGERIFDVIDGERLNLYNKKIANITDLEGLEKIGSLKVLNLQFNNITRIEGLDHLANLKELGLSFNLIETISGIEELKNLEHLDLSSNNIHSIEGIDHLTNLKFLDLRNNDIDEIKGLEKLVNLRKLYLGGNKITEIKGLENLKNLEILDLTNNQIRSFPDSLSSLTSLKKIYLINCNIDYFPPELSDIVINYTNSKTNSMHEEPDYNQSDIEEFQQSSSKRALWGGKPTIAFRKWLSMRKNA